MIRIRKFLLVMLILLSLGLCYQVNSYTYASIKNSVNVMISSSENALIAIPEDDIQINKSYNYQRVVWKSEELSCHIAYI